MMLACLASIVGAIAQPTDIVHARNDDRGVPRYFGDPQSLRYQRLGTEAARVHAAIAWTFGLPVDKYAPVIQT